MATIQERTSNDGSISYRVQIRLKGFPPVSASFQRKTDARRWANQTEAAMLEGRHFKTTEAKRHTIGDMIDRYIKTIMPRKKERSRSSQLFQLEWWKTQIGAMVLASVTPAQITELRDQLAAGTTRRNKPRSPSTVVRYLAVLSHCYTIAMKEWGWVEDNPLRRVSKPKEPRGRVRFLSDEEREKLIAACRQSHNKLLYPIVILAISTGMRRGEIMNLTWADIDFERSMLTIMDTKNDERRSVPLLGLVAALLTDLSKVRRLDTTYVFPSPVGPGHSAAPRDIQSAWRHAVAKAGIEDFKFHDLRHTAASYLAMNGATLAEIAEILGHKTLSMVKRYSHLSESHTAQVVGRMNTKIFGGEK